MLHRVKFYTDVFKQKVQTEINKADMHAKLTYNNANAENKTLHISVLSLMILMRQKKTTLNLKSANIRD